jgi:hypothetical protein
MTGTFAPQRTATDGRSVVFPIVSITNTAEDHKEQKKNSQVGCDNSSVFGSEKHSQSSKR